MDNLLTLNRKWGHLRNPSDGLIEGESNGLVVIRTNDYFFHQDIVNTRTGERYKVKYYNAGRFPPYKKIFEVSKALNGVRYAIIIGLHGAYYIRSGTYRVAELVDGRLEPKNFYSPKSAVAYALHLHRNNIKPELI